MKMRELKSYMREIVSFHWMLTAVAVVMTIFLPSSVVGQQDFWWNNPGVGDFGDPSNWDPSEPPGPPGFDDTAIFNLPDNYWVTIDQDHTNQRLVVEDGNVEFKLWGFTGNGSIYALEHDGVGGDASVVIGQSDVLWPSLNVTGGTMQANACILAVSAGGGGSLTVDGSNTFWTNRGDFCIGEMGYGSASFLNGATVNSFANVFLGTQTDGTNAGSGDVYLEGQAGQVTNWTIGDDSVYDSELDVGYFGYGSISVGPYSTLTMREHQVDDEGNRSSGWVFLGSQTGSYGSMTVSGEQAEFNVEHSPVIIGGGGNGDLHVNNGGRMWMGEGELWLATQSDSTGYVDVVGSGSTLEEHSAYPSVIGMWGEGTLDVGNYGSASFSHLIIGQNESSSGSVHLFDNGSLSSGYSCLGDWGSSSYGEVYLDQNSVWTITERMNVGREGYGTISIWGGSLLEQTFSDTFALNVGVEQSGGGVITIQDNGSGINSAGELVIGASGIGRVEVYSGGHVTVKQSHLGTVAGSEGYLTVSGTDTRFDTTDGGLLVGREGYGELLLDSGAVMSLAGRLDVGEQPGGVGYAVIRSHAECDGIHIGRWGANDTYPAADGSLRISGRGAGLNSTSQIVIGYEGYGKLLLDDTAQLYTAIGGSPTGTSGVLGAGAGSTGSAFLENAYWGQDGTLVVGWSGMATLDIADWGSVESESGQIGKMSGSIGTVNVNGDHAVWNIQGDMAVGGSMDEAGGTGSLVVGGGEGHVRVGCGGSGGTLRVWQDGLVHVGEGRMVVGSDILSGVGALWVASAGVLDLCGGTVEATYLDVDGTLSGYGLIVGDIFINSGSGETDPGILSPGQSPGTLTLDGDLMLNGLAEFDILDSGEFDLVRQGSSGLFDVTFGGTLDLRFTGEFGVGDQWLIFDFNQYYGNFTGVQWSGLSLDLMPQFNPTTGTVMIIPEPGMLGMLAIGGIMLFSRWRRNAR